MNAPVKYIKKYSYAGAPLWLLILKKDGIEYHIVNRRSYGDIKKEFISCGAELDTNRLYKLKDFLYLYEVINP